MSDGKFGGFFRNQGLTNSIMAIVTTVWVGSFLAGVFVDEYAPPVGLNAIMMAVVGFLFAGKKSSQDEDRDDG